MLKEYGNVLEENIPINEELLRFAKANNYKICLKTGTYNHSLEKLNRLIPYNREIIDQIYHLYISGKLYPPDYFMVFDLSSPNMIVHILRRFHDMTGLGVRRIYGEKTLSKRRITVEEVYGVDNVSKSSKVKQKKIATCLKNYGVQNPSHDPQIRRKAEQTMIRKFGVYNVSLLPEIKLKKATLSIEKFDSPTPLTSIHFLQRHDKRPRSMGDIIRVKERYDRLYELEMIYRSNPTDENRNNLYNFILDNYQGSSLYQHLARFGFNTSNLSGPERFAMSLLKDINPGYEHNARSSHQVRNENGAIIELDFYYPEFNLGIEVNGLGVHSVNAVGRYEPKTKDYHFRKFLKFHKSGILMLSFTDYELYKFKDDVVNIIKHHLKLLENIHVSEEFLEFNQIKSLKESLNYGIFDESLLSDNFENHQHQRFIKEYEYWDNGVIKT